MLLVLLSRLTRNSVSFKARGAKLFTNVLTPFQRSLSKSDSNKIDINKLMSLRFRKDLPNESSESSSKRLVVLITWMLAKEAHIEKYRELYFKHGFDVLTIRTTPFSLTFPTKGSQIVAKKMLDYLKTQIDHYPHMVVHGFSAGAYQFAEMLVQMNRQLNSPQVDPNCLALRSSIKGLVFDSAVDFDRIPSGFSRALTNNTVLIWILEMFVNSYVSLCYNISTKYWRQAFEDFYKIPLRCPILLLCSHSDEVGDPESSMKLAKLWRELGINVSLKCWNDTKHVSHIIKYPDEYSAEVDNFLQLINLNGISCCR